MQNPSRFDPGMRVLYFEDAVRLAGNRRQLAKLLGVTASAVYQWKGRIPWDHLARVEELLQAARDAPRGTKS